jgi:hypothetical protein
MKKFCVICFISLLLCGCLGDLGIRFPDLMTVKPLIDKTRFKSCETLDDYVNSFDGFTVNIEWKDEPYKTFSPKIMIEGKEFSYK